jgi:hypothetical protein
MIDVLLLPLAIVLLLGWSPVVVCFAWAVGMLICALAWSAIVAALSLIGRALHVR